MIKVYMDNSNVWFITVEDASDDIMKAITCIINSTVFSVLAKAGANPQLNNYYKFNKQFLEPVPFPVEMLYSGKNVEDLANLYNDISQIQNIYLNSTFVSRVNIAEHLNERWSRLDSICNELYGLSEADITMINEIGRTVDRVDLLNR